MRYFSTVELLKDLQGRCERDTQKAVSKALKLPPAFVNDVLHGRRDMTRNMATAMGYWKMPDRYRKAPK